MLPWQCCGSSTACCKSQQGTQENPDLQLVNVMSATSNPFLDNSLVVDPAQEQFEEAPLAAGFPAPEESMSSVKANGPLYPDPPLQLLFRLQDGSTRMFGFSDKPIGVYFRRRTPVKINKVASDSPAFRQGVKEGWVILQVNGQDVSTLEINEIIKLLKDSQESIGRPT